MNSTYKNIILLFAVFFLFGCSATKTTTSQQIIESHKPSSNLSIQSQIDTLLDNPVLSEATVGIKIVNLNSGEILYEKNSAKLLRPASSLKLITTSAALALLKKDFWFKTEVLHDGRITGKTLDGNLYLKGSGDPLVTAESLDSLARMLSKNINTVTGNLIGDVSYFDDVYWGKGWLWDDEPEAFAAFISPLTMNSNVVKVYVRPGRKEGDSAVIRVEPLSDQIKIENYALTSSGGIDSRTDSILNHIIVTRQANDNTIIIAGSISLKSVTREFWLSVKNPEFHSLALFRQKLESHKVKVYGDNLIDNTSSSRVIGSINNKLDTVIFEINKRSNNLASENLLKTISSELLLQSGSSQQSIFLIKNFLSSIDIDTSKFIMMDGSGLSRYNLVSADAFIKLLNYIYKNRPEYDIIYNSLPVGGIDGTLKNRFAVGQTKGNVRAKTGTHSDAVTLTGYVNTISGSTLAFSILVNNFTNDTKEISKAIDAIVEVLAGY